jgi:hypothetical protein
MIVMFPTTQPKQTGQTKQAEPAQMHAIAMFSNLDVG